MLSLPFMKPRVPFIALLAGSILFVDLFVVVLAGLSLRESYRQHQARAELTSQNISQLVDKQLASDFEKIDLSMLAVADEIERQIAATQNIDGLALKRLFWRLQARVPEIDSLRVADADGMVRYGTGVAAGSPVNVADREYFMRQRDTPRTDLLIARPVFTSIDNKWVIPISRRLERPDGSFAGVVYANISIAQINQTLAAIDVGRNGSVALRNDDLALVARYPMLGSKLSEIGTKVLFPEVQKLIQAGRSSGTVISR